MELNDLKRIIQEEYTKGNKEFYIKIKAFCDKLYISEHKEQRKETNKRYYLKQKELIKSQ